MHFDMIDSINTLTSNKQLTTILTTFNLIF